MDAATPSAAGGVTLTLRATFGYILAAYRFLFTSAWLGSPGGMAAPPDPRWAGNRAQEAPARCVMPARSSDWDGHADSVGNRLAEVGRVAGHVADQAQHKLQTSLLYLRLLGRRLSDDAGSLDVLAKVESGLGEVQAALGDLLQYTLERSPRPERVRVRPLIDEICASHALQLRARSIRVELDVPHGVTMLADREMLRRAVSNLVLNAIDAMPDGGELVCTSYVGPAGFELEIADSGPGLDAEIRRRAFEPFFSTKPGSTGLGLTIVERFAAAHGGRVTACNCPEGGAAFTIGIPSRAMEAAA